MRAYVIAIGVILIIAVAAFWAVNVRVAEAPSEITPSGPILLDARIGQEVNGLDVSITPLAVLQDSRCPVGVECIWAGTVKLQARLSSGLGIATQGFTLGEPITTEVETVTLTDVSPSPAAGVEIKEAEYVFQFKVEKRSNSLSPL